MNKNDDNFEIMKEILEVYSALEINIDELKENHEKVQRYTNYDYEKKSFLSGNSYAKL